jgi:hypothetical protein
VRSSISKGGESTENREQKNITPWFIIKKIVPVGKNAWRLCATLSGGHAAIKLAFFLRVLCDLCGKRCYESVSSEMSGISSLKVVPLPIRELKSMNPLCCLMTP